MPVEPELPDETEAAFRYRHRAEEIRVIAEETKDPKMRSVLLGVADDYVRMAATVERIACRDKAQKTK